MLQISSTPRVGRRTQKAFIDSRLRSTAKARPRKRNLYCAMVRLCDTAFAPAHRAQFRRAANRRGYVVRRARALQLCAKRLIPETRWPRS